MNELMNELITDVFVKQPMALPGSSKYLADLAKPGAALQTPLLLIG